MRSLALVSLVAAAIAVLLVSNAVDAAAVRPQPRRVRYLTPAMGCAGKQVGDWYYDGCNSCWCTVLPVGGVGAQAACTRRKCLGRD